MSCGIDFLISNLCAIWWIEGGREKYNYDHQGTYWLIPGHLSWFSSFSHPIFKEFSPQPFGQLTKPVGLNVVALIERKKLIWNGQIFALKLAKNRIKVTKQINIQKFRNVLEWAKIVLKSGQKGPLKLKWPKN